MQSEDENIIHEKANLNDIYLLNTYGISNKSNTNIEFFDYVKRNKIVCINLNLESLNLVLHLGTYLNIFELGYDLHSIEKRYNKSKISPYFDKLMRFVEMYDPNKKIKYGSLNTGGLGSNYPGFGSGLIAMILTKEYVDFLLKRIVCIKRFSLNYFKNDLTFKTELFEKEISTWSHVEYLAYFKHEDQLSVTKTEDWNQIISNSKGWTEILIWENILLQNIAEIRIESNYYKYLNDLDSPDDIYDDLQRKTFNSVKEILTRNNIKLKTI